MVVGLAYQGDPRYRDRRRSRYSLRMRLDRMLSTLRAAFERLGLDVNELVLVLCGLATLAGSVVVFGGATGDVTQHTALCTTTHPTCASSPAIARIRSCETTRCSLIPERFPCLASAVVVA